MYIYIYIYIYAHIHLCILEYAMKNRFTCQMKGSIVWVEALVIPTKGVSIPNLPTEILPTPAFNN